MCAKTQDAVRTPAALDTLRGWLALPDPTTRRRGEEHHRKGRVIAAWAEPDNNVEADIEDRALVSVSLHFAGGGWSSRCTCGAESACSHAVAAGLAWIGCAGVDFDIDKEFPDDPDDDFVIPTPPHWATPLKSPSATWKKSFRDEWSPLLAEKLGRSLTGAEAAQLGQLSSIFHEFKTYYGRLYAHSLARHGFPASAEAVDANGAAYADWFEPDHPPADPWALWQYIAYDWERSGREIPAAFRPMTDTAELARRLEQHLLAREIDVWRRSLNPAATPMSTDYTNSRPPVAQPAGLRLRLAEKGSFHLEVQAGANKPWKPPTAKWLAALGHCGPADFAPLPAAATALAQTLAAESRDYRSPLSPHAPVSAQLVTRVLAYAPARGAVVMPDGSPWRVESDPLHLEAIASPAQPQRLDLQLTAPDGRTAREAAFLFADPEPHYLHAGRIHRGPPRCPRPQIPVAALADPGILSELRRFGLRLPASLEVRRVTPRAVLRCWLEQVEPTASFFHARLFAESESPRCAQHWRGEGGWSWTHDGAPARQKPDDSLIEFDLTVANAAGARFIDMKFVWSSWNQSWTCPAARDFPELFLNWRSSLPAELVVEAQGELAGLAGPAVRAHLDFSALPAAGESGRDWFDLTVALRVEDTTLDAEEIALLLKARGKWVQLPRHGWRRLDLTDSAEVRATLDRLGLDAGELDVTGKPVAHRLHALQLAGEAAALEARDARLADALRERVSRLATVAPPALPAGLRAELRPYQREGFHFLAHLSANRLGGVLADDMGLGKTVQTLAWLLHLADTTDRLAPPPAGPAVAVATKRPGRPKKSTTPATATSTPAVPPDPTANSGGPRPFRALVVCPKSVVHGWLSETERFAPALTVQAFTPAVAKEPHPPGPAAGPALLVANYAQLRINAAWFQQHAWDVVILDEAQFIKNPASQTAAVARALATQHRLALTGTPVENRLLDLWSLLAFAQPGLLGTQASFKRQHPDDDPAAPARLQRRARHFLLRRTKAQVATDLPPRTEDEIVVELEPAQRKLYDAELKRARAQLLGLETDHALDAVRFNILSSLLRLRQICCHPALVDPAHADLPSAKLDALLERLEELRDEGHQVLVFSQFTGMLDLIRTRLAAANIGHLILTGATENRADLVEKFQTDRTQTVFLLSLKAAGFGLNLTAASYAILYDPWWNPAVEAQAIDRTHRIGQTRPVTAYRLLADDTIEQKIRALQKEKATLAGSIVQEESLASVLDLESLKRILS